MIAGFPGETEAEFRELLDFVGAFRFDALGVFPYSQEPDTPAGRMANQVPGAVKEERVEALMTAQQAVAFSAGEQRIGGRFDVLVDEAGEHGSVRARHAGQAPLVDAVTIVKDCDASPGEFVPVRCTGREDYDLIAAPTRISLY
jgi:ribosomal protein S12 methylthiotransferase